MRSLLAITVSLLVVSGCGPHTYVVRVEHVADPKLEVVPAVRERDGAAVALERGTFRTVESARTPMTPDGTVRVGGRRHKHPLAKAGMSLFVIGSILSIVGVGILLPNTCVPNEHPCYGNTNAWLGGVITSSIGDAVSLLVGLPMWDAGVRAEPREIRYEPSPTAPVVGVRF